jgi:hypothetical protein
MASEDIKIRAKAGKLLKEGHAKLEGYRRLPIDELKQIIANIETGTKAKPAATAKNGASVATSSARKSAPAKSTVQKTVTKTAAKGTAKRPTAAAASKGKASPVKGSGKKLAAMPTKGKTTAKPAKAVQSRAKEREATAKISKTKAVRTRRKPQPGAARIDRSAVDWNAETGLGKRGGKRADVLRALRKRKGNYDKVFDDLQDQAIKWYPNALNTYPEAKSKRHAAEKMLRWLIGRVAFDFVMGTGQHEPGDRAAYGTSEADQDIRRRAQRAERAGGVDKVQRGRPAALHAAKKGKAAKMSTPTRTKAQKGTGGRKVTKTKAASPKRTAKTRR